MMVAMLTTLQSVAAFTLKYASSLLENDEMPFVKTVAHPSVHSFSGNRDMMGRLDLLFSEFI